MRRAWLDAWLAGGHRQPLILPSPTTRAAFKLTDVPAGTYTVEVWHEKLGKSTQKVTVKAKEDAKVNFEVAGK